jgi:hypothetical protein
MATAERGMPLTRRPNGGGPSAAWGSADEHQVGRTTGQAPTPRGPSAPEPDQRAARTAVAAAAMGNRIAWFGGFVLGPAG